MEFLLLRKEQLIAVWFAWIPIVLSLLFYDFFGKADVREY